MTTRAVLSEESRPLRHRVVAQQFDRARQRDAAFAREFLDALSVALGLLHARDVFRFAAIFLHRLKCQQRRAEQQRAKKSKIESVTQPPIPNERHREQNDENERGIMIAPTSSP